eukprot:5760077-Prymnesium_polylepis.1
MAIPTQSTCRVGNAYTEHLPNMAMPTQSTCRIWQCLHRAPAEYGNAYTEHPPGACAALPVVRNSAGVVRAHA